MPLYAPPVLGRWLSLVCQDVVVTSQTFTVGRVLLGQFVVPTVCQVDGLAYAVGSTSAGNVIGGIVGPVAQSADTPLGAVVIAESASTAQATATTVQVLTWTAVTLAPGIYYAALEGSDVTGTYLRTNNPPGTGPLMAPGVTALYDRGGGYGALTSPTPAVTLSGTAIPGLRVRVA